MWICPNRELLGCNQHHRVYGLRDYPDYSRPYCYAEQPLVLHHRLGLRQGKQGYSIAGIPLFWNRKDARASTEVFDAYNIILQKLDFTVLDTVIPETNRYNKELSLVTRTYFRCTLFPPPAKLLKGSGLIELAEELLAKLKP